MVLSIWVSKELDFFFDRQNNKEGNLNAVKNNYNSLFTSASHMTCVIPVHGRGTMQHLTLPSVMYLQLILRNFSVRASSSSEVDDTTLDWRRGGNTGG